MSYPPVYPHGDIEEIGNEIYLVRGSIKMNPIVRITRNMVLIRDSGELSLVNPIRVNDPLLNKICSLGEIKHVIRTGAFHGLDDPFYVDKYSAKMWSQTGGTIYTAPPIDIELTTETVLPFANGTIVVFPNTKQPECVLHVADGDGLLVTCDVIQHYGDYSYNNLPARLLMPFIGFPKTTLVGPLWLKLMTREGQSLEADIRQLLNLKFNRLISAHGTYLQSGAHEAVSKAIDKVFSK